jgi:hypothetical protein
MNYMNPSYKYLHYFFTFGFNIILLFTLKISSCLIQISDQEFTRIFLMRASVSAVISAFI